MPENLIEMFFDRVDKYGGRPAFKVMGRTRYEAITYHELADLVREFAAGLISLGMKKGDRVALITDNRLEWIVSDLAIIAAGGWDVPRGSDSLPHELEYIIKHSEAKIVLVEDRKVLWKLQRLLGGLPSVENIVVLDEKFQERADEDILSFDGVLRLGREKLSSGNKTLEKRIRAIRPEDVLTIIYTSGTTGDPKGVMLTHSNIMHQVRHLPRIMEANPFDRWLSILPPWHIFERAVEYSTLASGASTAYSRPVRRVLLRSFELEQPTYMATVPRVLEGIVEGVRNNLKRQGIVKLKFFESMLEIGRSFWKAGLMLDGLYPNFEEQGLFDVGRTLGEALATRILLHLPMQFADKEVFSVIRERTGGQLRAIISGGAALPPHVDDFFHAVGISIYEGYGLTETSPVCTVRYRERDVPYTVGPILPETDIKIVDAHNRSLPPGRQGVIKVKGPHVMKGYYRDEEATRQVIDPEGWFDTGDLGRLTITGELQITGRAKDTIVLRTGKNVEPEPIEGRLKESPYILQAMVVGQDRKNLGALLVPNFETLSERLGRKIDPSGDEGKQFLQSEEMKIFFKREIERLLNEEVGFKSYERVQRFVLLTEDFRVGEELTHTLKMKRDVIEKRYGEKIENMYWNP
jgi:long-chain acyl-CoA synthetase